MGRAVGCGDEGRAGCGDEGGGVERVTEKELMTVKQTHDALHVIETREGAFLSSSAVCCYRCYLGYAAVTLANAVMVIFLINGHCRYCYFYYHNHY